MTVERPKRATSQRGSIGAPSGVTVRSVWIEPEATYMVAVEAAEGVRVVLNDRQAFDHANAVLAAAHRALYDSAVLSQLTTKLKLPLNAVSTVANIMRGHRPPLDHTQTEPLRFEPTVDGKTGRPYLIVSIGTQRTVARWSTLEADTYARTVLSTVERARLDTVYHTVLSSVMGMEEWRAKNAVADLGTFHKY